MVRTAIAISAVVVALAARTDAQTPPLDGQTGATKPPAALPAPQSLKELFAAPSSGKDAQLVTPGIGVPSVPARNIHAREQCIAYGMPLFTADPGVDPKMAQQQPVDGHAIRRIVPKTCK